MSMKTYKGQCHCGKVAYEAELELGTVLACNCSMCARKGTLLSFIGESQFKLLQGEGNLSDYQFHKHVIHHLFCKTCGVTSFCRGTGPDGKAMVAINARCLEGVDPFKLNIHNYDGASV